MVVEPRKLVFVGDSHRILCGFPEAVQRHVGYAFFQAQIGGKHPDAKPLRGFPGGLLEVVSDHSGNTFRSVYTVRLGKAVYVLHAFQKKAKHGIATPKSEIDLVKRRLRRAIEIDQQEEV
jgi:phage-related protein